MVLVVTFLSRPHYIALVVLELTEIPLPLLLSAGTRGVSAYPAVLITYLENLIPQTLSLLSFYAQLVGFHDGNHLEFTL